MADKKTTDLTLHTTPELSDVLPIVNNGETKKVSYGTLKTKIQEGLATTDTNTFTNEQTISGSLFIQGQTELGGNLVPKTARGATLGTFDKPFSEIFVSSGSLNIASDNPGDPVTSLSNIDGNILVSAGGMRLVQPGNSFIAETGSFSYLSGSMIQIGDYDRIGTTTLTGSFSVTGSTLQVGNNILDGNTTLLGFVNISGSTSMTGSLEVTNGITTVDYITFDITPETTSTTPGTLSWNPFEGTLDLYAEGVTYQLGQEIAPLVRNNTGVTITNGTPVMFAGSLGASGRITVIPAIADGSIPSSYILGVATQDILAGTDGHTTTVGKVRNLDTTGTPYGQVWNEGDVLYVSETTPGYITNVRPAAPNSSIFVGVVINSHAINGTLFTRPSWRGNIIDLDDVDGTPLNTSGQLLVWNQTNRYFDPTDNINNYLRVNQTVPQTISGSLNISGSFILQNPTVPTSISGSGTQNEIRTDSDYIYVCIATNSWKRSPLSTW
jgi:hypothetical protein